MLRPPTKLRLAPNTLASCLETKFKRRQNGWEQQTFTLKSPVWQPFGFYEVEGMMDKTYTVCMVCRSGINYFGNTTNLRNHISGYHSELGEKRSLMPVRGQLSRQWPSFHRTRIGPNALLNPLHDSLYSVVENKGFREMAHTLEPKFKIPCRRYFTDPQSLHSTLKPDLKFWILWRTLEGWL